MTGLAAGQPPAEFDAPAALLARLEAIGAEVNAAAAVTLAGWRAFAPAVEASDSARNLAAYLALRRTDLADLQAALAGYGLSSLGRSESRVMSTLEAVRTALAALAGRAGASPSPIPAGSALDAATDAIFGTPDGPRTRIMATLPSEAAKDAGLARRLVEAGMDCARINCAHDDAAAWRAMAGHVRAAARAAGRDCRILMDVAGPKCRIEQTFGPEKTRLFAGDRFALAKSAVAAPGDLPSATISFPHIIDALDIGAQVWIDDGKLGARVAARRGEAVVLDVVAAREKGMRLKPEKGVNFPTLDLSLAPLGAKDLADLDTVADIADLVGYSFVQRVEDIALIHEELARRRLDRPPQALVLKIETRLAVHNLPRLIVAAAARGPVAVMIARGDLAVELGFARLAEMQEEIMWLCEAAGAPVIWATQVLETLVKTGLPSRGEATDAAMAQRAECVMLNKGPHLVEGVRFVADLLARMDRHMRKKSPRFCALEAWRDA